MFAYTKFLCDNIRLSRVTIVSPDRCCGDIFTWKCHYPYILKCNMVHNWCWRRSEIYTPTHLLASELGLPICCLLLAMRAMSGCDSVSTFSHIEKIATFQTLKNKIDKLTDMIDFGEFPSLSLESLSVIT